MSDALRALVLLAQEATHAKSPLSKIVFRPAHVTATNGRVMFRAPLPHDPARQYALEVADLRPWMSLLEGFDCPDAMGHPHRHPWEIAIAPRAQDHLAIGPHTPNAGQLLIRRHPPEDGVPEEAVAHYLEAADGPPPGHMFQPKFFVHLERLFAAFAPRPQRTEMSPGGNFFPLKAEDAIGFTFATPHGAATLVVMRMRTPAEMEALSAVQIGTPQPGAPT
jgi:hypothetical protein